MKIITPIISLLLLTSFNAKADTVILLHGLARTDRAMAKMEKALKAADYHVINHRYLSRSADIDTLTQKVFTDLKPQLETAKTVHFVTHSMGGIILQNHLKTNNLPRLGRVVMLAPPSRGSEVPDKLGHLWIYKKVNGPAGNQLGTDADSIPLKLPAPHFPLGVIAGDRSINPMLSLLIPGPDDGKVAVARVKPAIYTDFRLLHVTHACMMRNKQVIRETLHFLKHERFSEKTAAVPPASSGPDITNDSTQTEE